MLAEQSDRPGLLAAVLSKDGQLHSGGRGYFDVSGIAFGKAIGEPVCTLLPWLTNTANKMEGKRHDGLVRCWSTSNLGVLPGQRTRGLGWPSLFLSKSSETSQISPRLKRYE